MSIIYFDNAATSFPKPATVIKELVHCVKHYCGNPGRSSHPMSLRAAEEIYNTRECIANFFGCENPENVVFTHNATYAINIAIKTLIPRGSHIITSDIEHNAVIRPLTAMVDNYDVTYTEYNTDGNIREEIAKCVSPNTKAIVSTLQSNVTGRMIDLSALSDVAKKYQLKLIVDASQLAGHQKIRLSGLKCDAFCAPGHKGLFGIQGCGFAIFKDNTLYKSFVEGGSGNDSISAYMPKTLPEGYEAGTMATPAIVSLKKGIEYISSIGIDCIDAKLTFLTDILVTNLDRIEGIKVYSEGAGIVSFNYKDISSSIFSELLSNYGIYTRAGLHCAPSAHRKLGTLGQGTVRVSFSNFNTENEIMRLLGAIEDIAKKY